MSEKKSVGRRKKSVNAPPPNWLGLTDLIQELHRSATRTGGMEFLASFAAGTMGARAALVLMRSDDRLVSAGAAGLEAATDRAKVMEYARRLAGWVEGTRHPLDVADVQGDTRFPEPPEQISSVQVRPVLVSDQVVGSLIMFFDADARVAKDGDQQEFLAFLMALTGEILAGVTSREEADQLGGRTEDLERQLLSSRRLAATGELAETMAYEMKSPLASLGVLAARVATTMETGDARRAQLEIVVTEVARLERILEEQLEMAADPSPQLHPEDLNRILAESLMLLSDRFRERRIRITKRLGTDLPPLLLDPNLMRRVFLNMFRAGIESTRTGGRIKIQSRRKGDQIEVQVSADGDPEPGSALENLWKPFRVHEGPGEDVTTSGIQRILREHHAVLRVTTSPEWPLMYSLTLPIPVNQDRREAPEDRRGTRNRRRA